MKTPLPATITEVQDNWNVISNPSALTVNQSEITIEYNGTIYNWSEAFLLGIIDQNLFGWNRISQTYEFSTNIEPLEAYWLYSFEDCVIKRSTSSY